MKEEHHMHDRDDIATRIAGILDAAGAEYRVYAHRPVLTYEDIVAVAQETGWQGTEMKNLVQKAGEEFVVYVTLQGTRADTRAMKKHLGTKKLRMASDDELAATFGAEPGNAYPFGFDAGVRIIVDPAVYEQEWALFSPCRPDQTVQVRGGDLEKVFASLPNQVEVLALNKVDVA
jgi:prolyl-tRNA editing enzyme YbaK/EbsC (Cys-tRNA(Pro) deacylase)